VISTARTRREGSSNLALLDDGRVERQDIVRTRLSWVHEL
jgi:hypothetical protein